jgi:hypothetical protein
MFPDNYFNHMKIRNLKNVLQINVHTYSLCWTFGLISTPNILFMIDGNILVLILISRAITKKGLNNYQKTNYH